MELFPGAGRPGPAEVPYLHPLYRAVEQPPKLQIPGQPGDFESRTTLFLTMRVEETGKVSDVQAIEPPVKGFEPTATYLMPRWAFEPGKKEGRPVRTWATVAFDLDVEIEKGTFATFTLRPLEKTDPLQPPVKESSNEDWMARYPREIGPKDASAVSVEDVDIMPSAKKLTWKYEANKLRSRFTALLQISNTGAVQRVVPVGKSNESLILHWMRAVTSKWSLSPGLSQGQPVECWMYFDTALEYDLVKAKERGQRLIQKNLRGTPQS